MRPICDAGEIQIQIQIHTGTEKFGSRTGSLYTVQSVQIQEDQIHKLKVYVRFKGLNSLSYILFWRIYLALIIHHLNLFYPTVQMHLTFIRMQIQNQNLFYYLFFLKLILDPDTTCRFCVGSGFSFGTGSKEMGLGSDPDLDSPCFQPGSAPICIVLYESSVLCCEDPYRPFELFSLADTIQS